MIMSVLLHSSHGLSRHAVAREAAIGHLEPLKSVPLSAIFGNPCLPVCGPPNSPPGSTSIFVAQLVRDLRPGQALFPQLPGLAGPQLGFNPPRTREAFAPAPTAWRPVSSCVSMARLWDHSRSDAIGEIGVVNRDLLLPGHWSGRYGEREPSMLTCHKVLESISFKRSSGPWSRFFPSTASIPYLPVSSAAARSSSTRTGGKARRYRAGCAPSPRWIAGKLCTSPSSP